MNNAGIMTKEEFSELLSSKKPTVIDFSATWCGPCKMLAPIMEDISEKYKAKYNFYQVDIDSAEEIATDLNISAVPTIVVFQNGKEVGRTMGYQEFEDIENFLKQTINN